MSGLSQELIDCTIDEVPDMNSLKACSLVCRRWYPCSRKHLFARVELASETDLQRWCASVQPGPSGPSSLITNLMLSDHTRLQEQYWIGSSTAADAALHFQSFSALQVLEIQGWNMNTPSVKSIPDSFGSSLKTVTCLILKDVVVETIHHTTLTTFFGHFPRLNDISIAAINRRPSLMAFFEDIYRNTRVEIVPTHPRGEFSASGPVVSFTVFKGITLLKLQFRRVTFDCDSYESWSVYWPILAECAGSLEELQILAKATGE